MAEENKTDKGDQEKSDTPSQEKDFVQLKVLYEWSAPMRHFKKMNMKRYLIILACVLGLFVILAIVGQYWLMGAIAATMFFLYVVGTVPPVKIVNRITTLGIESLNLKVDWDNIKDYWFAKKDEQTILYVDTKMKFPGRVIMLIGEDGAEKVHKILKEKVPYKDLRGQSAISKMNEGVWINRLETEESDVEEELKKKKSKK